MTDQKKTLESLTCSAASEASASDLKQQELFKLSDSVSKTDSAKPSSESTGPTRQFTTTLEPSQQMDIEELTSSAVAFHASRGAWPGSSEAQKMTVISGRKCCELLKLYKVDGLLAKMCGALLTSRWASDAAFLTWKASGIKPSHLLFQLAPSMPRTDATESGLLHTPTATANQMAPSMRGRDAGSWWATPSAADSVGSTGGGQGKSLRTDVRVWPTPTASDHNPRGPNSKQQGLSEEVKTTALNRGQLNPTWVEWLQGFPIGHTDLKPSEMPLSRKSSRKSAKQSLRQSDE